MKKSPSNMNESSWKNRRSKKRLKHYSEFAPPIPLTKFEYKNGRVEDGVWIPNPKADRPTPPTPKLRIVWNHPLKGSNP
jgi:hypothetical protein